MDVYEVTLTQSRVVEVFATDEAEAIEGALDNWRATAAKWDPDVTDINVRKAKADDYVGNA